jgi:hypothetical protein
MSLRFWTPTVAAQQQKQTLFNDRSAFLRMRQDFPALQQQLQRVTTAHAAAMNGYYNK